MISRESEYINHRLTWLATLQGLLFASLGFAWKDGNELIPILGLLGIATSLSTLLSLYYAIDTIETLFTQWGKRCNQSYSGPDVIIHKHKTRIRLLFPWFVFPFTFALSWTVVLLLYLRP
jgi:hypothetical protein